MTKDPVHDYVLRTHGPLHGSGWKATEYDILDLLERGISVEAKHVPAEVLQPLLDAGHIIALPAPSEGFEITAAGRQSLQAKARYILEMSDEMSANFDGIHIQFGQPRD